MTRDSFLQTLTTLGIDQALVSRAMGLSYSTVNRFGNVREDGLPIPLYVLSWLSALEVMPQRIREKYLATFRLVKKA